MARKEPQNIDAEISVLGCGFLEKTALDKIMDEVTDEMLSYIDVLVDGPFQKDLYNISLAFRGSENQRIITLDKIT